MAFLDTREREVMKMRFVEHWEYHEIAASQSIPIGTVQWRVFNAKKKLAPHLAARDCVGRNEKMTLPTFFRPLSHARSCFSILTSRPLLPPGPFPRPAHDRW
jgi:Sigma-70, region 4